MAYQNSNYRLITSSDTSTPEIYFWNYNYEISSEDELKLKNQKLLKQNTELSLKLIKLQREIKELEDRLPPIALPGSKRQLQF